MRRGFSTSLAALRRHTSASPNLVLRPPIEPRAADVGTPENHALWQFFSNGKYMRPADELENVGEPWSIPQLRRKSFEDLHTLWYVCLKELNRVLRELRLVQQGDSPPQQDTEAGDQGTAFDETAKKIRTTMWHIRSVLAERYHGWRRSELLASKEYPGLFSKFRQEYLEADSNSDFEVTAQLERFQYAFYGINPQLEGNFPEPRLLRGLYVVARLKLERYANEQARLNTVNNVREAFLLFTAEHSPEGVERAISDIEQIRSLDTQEGEEMETLAELMKSFQKIET